MPKHMVVTCSPYIHVIFVNTWASSTYQLRSSRVAENWKRSMVTSFLRSSNPLRWAFHLVYEGDDQRGYLDDDLVVIKDASKDVDHCLADDFGFVRLLIKNMAKL
ncbi:hypothetical protein LIER_04258 [Lithospermum erythrorhizon]|uniref:Uncharacterized protein n=1 Tax=Lithospermum erythrorhizon TaxID=34254 RepID=A0AAV3NXP3_LITER